MRRLKKAIKPQASAFPRESKGGGVGFYIFIVCCFGVSNLFCEKTLKL